jgi:sterol desaturase/sphingolipid hydroxylase (fatty acid hydroxylase superfamily)
MDSFGVNVSWRPVAAVGCLVALLAWETAQPYFELFGRGKESWPARGRHAVRNLALGVLNILVIAVGFSAAWLFVTQWTAGHHFGLLRWLDLGPVGRTIVAVLLLDAWTYAWHRLNHRVPFLWRFHRLHHADRAMDVTTASRFHTGEIVLSSILRLPVLALIGCRIEELALYEVLMFTVVQFHHANVGLPEWLDRRLRAVIVTPSMHKIHHSNIRAECDSNYSSLFSWWDRIFRTRKTSSAPRKIVFGVGG